MGTPGIYYKLIFFLSVTKTDIWIHFPAYSLAYLRPLQQSLRVKIVDFDHNGRQEGQPGGHYGR